MVTSRTLSVVVCSYNGADRIGDCLTAIAHQNLPVEVLVVDDGSTDGTSEVASSYGVTVIRHQTNRGISASRNTGLRQATGSIVAFCDDDCSPEEDWTQNIVAAWKSNPEATVIGGLVERMNAGSFTQRYQLYRSPFNPLEIELARQPSIWYRFSRQFRPPQFSRTDVVPVYSVLGGNMSVLKNQVLQLGGFDENLIFGEGEEFSLSETVRSEFGENAVLVDPRVVVSHRFDPSLWKTWRRSYLYGKGAASRWRKQGGWPSLPIVSPMAILVTILLAPISLIAGIGVGVLTLSVPVISWLSLPNSDADIAVVAYPMVDLVGDFAGTFGFVLGMNHKAQED
jgi:glycosyltransferase involved in cell wall biosynthesis